MDYIVAFRIRRATSTREIQSSRLILVSVYSYFDRVQGCYWLDGVAEDEN
jgi:hypothetical protein